MTSLQPIRQIPAPAPWKKGDVLVLFGELFTRGYANGLVEEAERKGMTIVRATVGRREKDNSLRALNAEELALQPKPFINIPLEAGFDLEPNDTDQTLPIEQLKDVKLSDWQSTKLDFAKLENSKKRAIERFRKNTTAFLEELKTHIPPGANVLFAHLMAGGVPRTKVVMPLINRIVKGTGDRYIPSQDLWESEIGRFIEMNFLEVTAHTFHHLIDLSLPLRQHLQGQGSRVCYVAYGYHGTEILLSDRYQWQTYTPYVQGWAKMQLEAHAEAANKTGVHACVYNCPEILTNSSSIFQGVELSLYPLLNALEKEAPRNKRTIAIVQECAKLLKNGSNDLTKITDLCNQYFQSPQIRNTCQFTKWPQHTNPEQLEKMLHLSDEMVLLHTDQKTLMTAVLSEVVFEACGKIMLHDSWKPQFPVAWIGHDVIAKSL